MGCWKEVKVPLQRPTPPLCVRTIRVVWRRSCVVLRVGSRFRVWKVPRNNCGIGWSERGVVTVFVYNFPTEHS